MPERKSWEVAAEAERTPAGGDLYQGPELEEPFAKRPDLEGRRRADREPLPQHLEQGVGRRGKEHLKRIGPECSAGRTLESETVVELLEPVLDIFPLPVDGLDAPGRLEEVGHNERGLSRGFRPGSWIASA